MFKKFLKLILVLIIGIVFYLIHFYIPRFITEIRNPIAEEQLAKIRPMNLPDFIESRTTGKYISFTSEDGTQLSGFLTPSKTQKQKGTVILLHGIRSSSGQFKQTTRDLSKKGFNSIALDMRAHGKSEGSFCTFGVKEKRDISALIDYLESNENISDNYGVWGKSLGGAVALQSLAFDSRLKFGIVESTFSDFRTIAHDYAENIFGYRCEPLLNYLISRSATIAGFVADEAKPELACKSINQPILMIHGTADKNIKIEYGKTNFDNLASKDKTWVEIVNGAHNGVSDADPSKYNSSVKKFLNKISKS